MNEEEQNEQLQESFEEIEPETEETEAREEAEEAAVEPQPEETAETEAEESPTGGELPKSVEQQPTQMFIAKKRDEEKDIKQSKYERFKSFIVECKRVLKVTKKPDKLEFKTIVKVSGIGILIIGLIGFLINMAKELFF
jgi:protein transport protein SEC61 subunit gamma and related proteins